MWFLIAFLNPSFHGASNVLDHYLTTKVMPNLNTLMFFGVVFDLLFIPIIYWMSPFSWDWSLWPLFLVLGVLDVAYIYPYFLALQEDDTSVVASLFNIGSILVPVLAFFIVGELLRVEQYVGFVLIILASIGLTLSNTHGKLKLNRAFWLMMLSSLLISLEVVLFEYVFTKVSWSQGFVGSLLFSALILLPLLLIPHERKSIFSIRRSQLGLMTLEQLLTFIGMAAGAYALSLGSATVVKGIFATQPFFVLIYALLFARFAPTIFREKIDRKSLVKKGLFFALALVGVVLLST